MKTLLLGGGFVGSHIVRVLVEHGIDVVVMGRVSPANGITYPEGTERVVADFTDGASLRKALAGCDAVVHAGAYYPVFSLQGMSQEQRAVGELRSVLSACSDAGITKFVLVSSPMVLSAEEKAFRTSTYHHIKRALHNEVTAWTAKGFPGIIVIPGACFGPGDAKPTTGRLILEIASGRMKFFLGGVMNAVDVRDVAFGVAGALMKADVGTCYQLGNWNCTIAEFTAEVARVAGVPAPRLKVPYMPTRTLALAAEWLQFHAGARRPFLPCTGLDQAHYGSQLDSSRAEHDLDFTGRPIATTIHDTIEYFHTVGYLRRPSQDSTDLKRNKTSFDMVREGV